MSRSGLPTDDDSALFRREAMEAQRASQIGEIVLLPGIWSRWTALAAIGLVICAGLLISLGSFTRRSTVQGQLIPDEGLIRVATPQSGVVIERRIRDGQSVRRGDALFVVSDDRAGPDAPDYQRVISRQIDARRQSLEDELRGIGGAERQEEAQLRRRAESLTGERMQVTRQGQLLEARVKGAEDASARYKALHREGFVSRDELLLRESELTEVRARLQGQRREALALEREISTTQRELDSLRARFATRRSELERSVLQVRQEYTEIEARRRVVVAAPADGQITLLQAEVGQRVDLARPLAHLVPKSSQLVARLYVPSRSAGFVKPGMRVQVRYDSYPYQKFGMHEGKVISISAAGVSASELPADGAPTLVSPESLFAVSVALPAQTISGAAGVLPLQVGMRLEADLMHETRRLYEWILEPLYAARARMDGGS